MGDTKYLAELAGALVVALTVIAFGLQALLKNWKSNSTEGSLLKVMHTELERMSKQNAILSIEVGNLQTQLIALNQQLTNLSIENQKLKAEISELTGEITRLNSLISERETP